VSRLARFWRQSGIGARFAMAAVALSILIPITAIVVSQGAAESAASFIAGSVVFLIEGAIAIALQALIVLGLASKVTARKMTAEVAAVLMGLFALLVATLMRGEIDKGVAPDGLWVLAVLIGITGVLYLAAAVLTLAAAIFTWIENHQKVRQPPGIKAT
jgi:hypothetical protein